MCLIVPGNSVCTRLSKWREIIAELGILVAETRDTVDSEQHLLKLSFHLRTGSYSFQK